LCPVRSELSDWLINIKEYLGLICMSVVKVRIGDSIDKALRALKKRLDKEGVMKSVKAHRFYSKPSIKKRAKSKAALKYKKQR
jgi:small subunit ribosomal protein S21